MADSILNDTKNVLGLAEGYDVFDLQVLMHINSVFSTLHQLGLPTPGDQFEVEDEAETWEEFFTLCGPVKNIKSVKTYMYMKVRMLFDPPTTSFAIQAMKEQVQELEFRINVVREDEQWVDPNPPDDPEE